MTNAELLQMARENLNRIAAASAPADALRDVIEAHELVFALYPEQSPQGFDTYLIKGKPLVVGASDEDLAKRSTTAVPCADLEEAMALERTFGDNRPGKH
jgi:hypothetical protein